MYFPQRKSNFDKDPVIKVEGHGSEAWKNYGEFTDELKRRLCPYPHRKILVIDCYHGVRIDEILEKLVRPLSPVLIVRSDDAKLPEETLRPMLERNLTDDRVFGVLSVHRLAEFFDLAALTVLRDRVTAITEGLVVVIGVGASLVTRGDVLVYADLPRWEIQLRYRSKELDNWGAGNFDEDLLRKYKRGFFIEWRMLDRHKQAIFNDIDYLLDTTLADTGKAVTGDAIRDGILQASQQPFELVPYFDEGIWGGKWMEEVCDLQPRKHNIAWCFNGVPEENAVRLQYGDVWVEIPAINIVHMLPDELLGPKVHARFGREFPIRFDFLDTMQGGNLSLQVHPLTEYIQETFGMHYTQDESYYILDAEEDAHVYLGLKDGVDPDQMIDDLTAAQEPGMRFDDEQYVNCIPVKKHDHVLIPAGTVHCSGAGTMVLEISATPYIFTFKLWDWGRVGLDGRPRPVHIDHGRHVIQYDRTTDWVNGNLIHTQTKVAEGPGWLEERTGLHPLEFIETRRHWFSVPVNHDTNGSVNVLNLIDGEEAVVESPSGAFEPMVVHYAETFIVPASVGRYTIRPYGKSAGRRIATIKAYIRL